MALLEATFVAVVYFVLFIVDLGVVVVVVIVIVVVLFVVTDHIIFI